MPAKPLFMVDHMLIKLGKYLRILGYDAGWDKSLRTHELITRANAEGRVFLTRNRRVPQQHPIPVQMIVLEATDPVRQLEELVSALRLDLGTGLFSRCIRCNVPLKDVPDKRAIESKVHPNVYRSFERFYSCPSCGTVFWKGGHVSNTCRKLGLDRSLNWRPPSEG